MLEFADDLPKVNPGCQRHWYTLESHEKTWDERRFLSALAKLSATELSDALKPYDIELLEFTPTDIEIRGLLSLTPLEAASTALSKTTGRISKWLSEHAGQAADLKPLAKGYFAVTTGQSTAVRWRQGVFHAESAKEVTKKWLELPGKFLIDKVSFVPHHVHVAVSVHPTVTPTVLACELMNCSQELMRSEKPNAFQNKLFLHFQI